VPEIVKEVTPRSVDPFDKYYAQYLLGALTMLKYKFYHENLLVHREEELKILQQGMAEKDRIIYVQSQEIARANRAMRIIYNSWTYKVGSIIVGPLRFVRRNLK
jgi:hypothetical protein